MPIEWQIPATYPPLHSGRQGAEHGGEMGAPVAGTMLRRALATLIGPVMAFAVLAVTASPAHALHVCDSSTLPCIQAVPDTYTTTFNTQLKVTSAALGVMANDFGGITTKVTDVNSPSFPGGATVNVNTDGTFTYTPDKNNPFSGIDTFDYTISDNGQTDTATVTVNVNAIVTNDSYSVLENHKLVVPAPGVLKNDAGFGDSSLVFGCGIEVQPNCNPGPVSAHGVTVFADGNGSDGSFDYTPPHNFVGTDTFHYQFDDIDGDKTYTGTVTIHVIAPPPPPPAKPTGYWMVGGTGIVYAFGQVRNYGNAPTNVATHIEPTPSRKGYWVLDAYGRVFAFGDAHVFGSPPGLRRGEFARSISSTRTGNGYWIFTDHGRVFPRGDARSFGDMSQVALNAPIIGSATTPTGAGYYMVATDGGIFSFGDAHFYGSMGGTHLNQPVNGLVPTLDNLGYWLVASDGGIFAFGDARFHGSMGGSRLNRPIIGMVRYGDGYLMVSSDGGIFDFSNLPFSGSLGNNPPPVPIVGVASGG
jgi:Big-like domain-containing protein